MLEWMQHDAIDHSKDVTLTFLHWLLIIIYLLLKFWHSRRSRIHKQPPELFLQILLILLPVLKAFRPVTLLKRDSYTGVFLWNLRNSEEHLFWKQLNDCFCVLITSSYIDFYNPLQYTIFIFTNSFFFITQLKQ